MKQIRPHTDTLLEKEDLVDALKGSQGPGRGPQTTL